MRLSFVRSLLSMSLLATTAPSITAFTFAFDAGEGLRSLILARDPLGLFHSRDDGCSSIGLSSDFTSCGMGLPNNFCCNTKAGETCTPFNNNQSVICCPKGTDCSKFYQIGCQAQGLNVTAPGNANSSIHSTVVNGGLVTCSSGNCCPLGYLCDTSNTNLCVPSNSSSTTSPSAAASLSNAPTTTATPTPGSSASDSQAVTEDSKCQAFPTIAVLVGFFPGMVLGILLTIITIVCLGRNSRRNREAQGAGSPMPSPKAIDPANRQVSGPIMQDTGATRVDFLRRMSGYRGRGPRSPTGTSQTAINTPLRNSARVRSLFSGKRDPAGEDIPEVPSTPVGRMKREPSTETINVFSPPNLHYGAHSEAGSRDTRWDDVMQGAGGLGVSKGIAAPPAFLGSPGMVDPRKRGLDGSTQGFGPKRKY